MADLHKSAGRKHRIAAGTFGNKQVAHAQRNLNGAAVADVVVFFTLPRGTKLMDSVLYKTGAAAAAGSTMKLGIRAVHDGAQGNDSYFNAAKALDGASSINRKDAVTLPLVLDDDYDVIGTIAGVAVGAVDTKADVLVEYEFEGNL